jgi:hypothetical protein
MSTFKHSKGIVVVEFLHRRGADPTTCMEVTITRNDDHEFEMKEFQGVFRLTGGVAELITTREVDINNWCKQHSLPSLSWIDDQVGRLFESDEADYGNNYIPSDHACQ